MKYFVMTLRKPTFDPSVVEAHYAFLDGLKAKNVLEDYGPFTDGSGGAYVLRAGSLSEAEAIAFSDPVHVQNCSDVTVYEWNTRTNG